MDPEQSEWYRRNLKLGMDWQVDGVDYSLKPFKVVVHVSFTGNLVCPVCGQTSTGYDTRTRTWRDLDYGNARCDVEAIVPRVNCKRCGIHEVAISWAGLASNLTGSLEKRILEMIRSSHIAGAAKHYGVDDKTCWKILRCYTDLIVRDLSLKGLKRIALDETSSTKSRSYISNVIDPDLGVVIYSTDGKDSTVLDAFRYWLVHHHGDPNDIEVICCDMSTAFIAGIERVFPNAAICFDKFHVIQHANMVVDAVRRRSGMKGKKAKGLRFGFTMNKEDLQCADEGYRQRIHDALASYDELGKAYAVKEALRDFYLMGDKVHASYFLRGIACYCHWTKIEELEALGNLIENHFAGILHWHEYRITNGFSEGTNSVIQAMKATSRGFRDVDNMIAMIHLRSTMRHPSLSSNSLLPGI